MNVLVACECSGAVRRAFRERGHNAWSCDLKPADDGPPHHIVGDALEIIKRGCEISPGVFVPWELVIAHPPCTYLCNSGALRLYKGGKFANGIDVDRWIKMERAAFFFRRFFKETPCNIVVENPIMHGHARECIGLDCCPRQIIQPHQFGDDASKATVLWLRGVPPLKPTKSVPPRIVGGLKRWANQTDSGQNRLGPSETRAAERAVTYPGIAAAMAEQWGGVL